jgi:hypothetical protein
VVVLALLGACGPAVSATGPSVGRSVGADATSDAPTGQAFPGEQAIPAPPDAFEGAPAAAVAPPAQLSPFVPPAPTGTGVWAVIIGIDDYPGRGNDLRSAVNDAGDMDAALGRYGVPPGQRVRLSDGQADAATIVRGLDWLTAHAGPDATAVFFYAGHVRRIGRGTEALVGADGRVVTDAEVASHLVGLRARRTWLVIAGCFGGGFTEALAPGRILTAAAPADQLAYESLALHRSYLVEYLVREAMLEGRADASVEEAFAWALAALRRDHPDRLPVQFDEAPGDLSLGPLPLPVTPRRAASSRPAPAPTTTSPPRPDGRGPSGSDDQPCVLTVGSTIGCPKD